MYHRNGPAMSDTPIAERVAADLGMAWPLRGSVRMPDGNRARLAEWCVSRPPQRMAGQLDSGVGGSPDGAAPDLDPDTRGRATLKEL